MAARLHQAFSESEVNLDWKMDLRGEHDTPIGIAEIVDKSTYRKALPLVRNEERDGMADRGEPTRGPLSGDEGPP